MLHFEVHIYNYATTLPCSCSSCPRRRLHSHNESMNFCRHTTYVARKAQCRFFCPIPPPTWLPPRRCWQDSPFIFASRPRLSFDSSSYLLFDLFRQAFSSTADAIGLHGAAAAGFCRYWHIEDIDDRLAAIFAKRVAATSTPLLSYTRRAPRSGVESNVNFWWLGMYRQYWGFASALDYKQSRRREGAEEYTKRMPKFLQPPAALRLNIMRFSLFLFADINIWRWPNYYGY